MPPFEGTGVAGVPQEIQPQPERSQVCACAAAGARAPAAAAAATATARQIRVGVRRSDRSRGSGVWEALARWRGLHITKLLLPTPAAALRNATAGRRTGRDWPEPIAPRPPGRKSSCVSLLSDGFTREGLEASAVYRLRGTLPSWHPRALEKGWGPGCKGRFGIGP